jgi:hypothetical protein
VMTPVQLAEFAAELYARKLAVQSRNAEADAALDASLTEIRTQIATLKEIVMGLVSDFKAHVANANATFAATTLTLQQLRQRHDALEEQLAIAQQAAQAAPPPLPEGSVVLSATEAAELTAALASAEDSRQAAADAVEANALLQAPPAP